ncbi:Ribose-phosphate pyrophosphokinase 2, partial [Perkinsus olseni]
SSEARAVRVRALQRAEISSWFNGAPVEALKRGNVRVWIAEYFFEGYEVLWDGQFPSVWPYGVL